MAEVEVQMTDQQRISKYYNLINGTRAFKTTQRLLPIAEELFFLGVPQFVENIPTACVSIDENGEVVYLWNPSFFDKLIKDYDSYYSHNLPSLYFVALHEALHIVLGHIFRGEGKNSKLWNYACDIVINEALFAMTHRSWGLHYATYTDGVDMPKEILRANQFGLTTKQVLEMSAEEVYNYLISQGYDTNQSGQGESSDQSESGGSGGSENGENGENGDREEKQAKTGNHDNWDEIADNVNSEVVDARNNEVFGDYSDASTSDTWGNLAAGEIFKFGKINKSVDWDQVLFDHLASKVGGPPQIEEKWAPANRRLQSFYPNVLLPVEHREIGKKIIKILVAIDTSGSISNKQLQGFINVVAAVPDDRTEVEVIYFDTQYYDGDWDEFKKGKINIQGRGGTAFNAILSKLNTMAQYPDEVLVFTDGDAYNISIPKEKQERWVWILTRTGREYYIKKSGGKIIKINNIM